MSNVIAFPRKECLMAFRRREADTGREFVLLEHVSAAGRMIVGEYFSTDAFNEAVEAWKAGGSVTRSLASPREYSVSGS